jgi:probable F420-dependent oxidoreductase
MKFGIFFANVGPFAHPEGFSALVRAAEEAGFESLWCVEHVALPVALRSPYPYTADGSLPLPPTTPLADPLIALAHAAALSERLRLATGVLLAGQRHPAYVAKQVATLDVLSRGRAILGVGIGWLREEYELLGLRFEERVSRTEECVRAVRALWSPEPQRFLGRHFRMEPVHAHPKPVQPGGVPVVFGGTVEAAARRAARLGDGFFPVDGDPARIEKLLDVVRDECRRIGRDAGELELTTSPGSLEIGAIRRYEDLGVARLVIPPPAFDAEGLRRALGDLGERVIAKLQA